MVDKVALKSMDIKDLPKLLSGKAKQETELVKGQTGKYEVNLVPVVKLKMIKMQKLRNLIFFICIVISVACGSVVAILGSIKVGQDVITASQDGRLERLSGKVNGYSELSQFLTIQAQIARLNEIGEGKKVLSRVFGILAAILPNGENGNDLISLSELKVNLGRNTFSFDAMADARKSPEIDYRVLEAFKKEVRMMKYDYGRYVDKDGNEIPSRCIVETDPGTGELYTENGSIYAIWTRGLTGCDPAREDFGTDKDGNVYANSYTLWGASVALDDTAYTGNNNSKNDKNKNDDDEDDDEEDEDAEVAKKTVDVVPNEKIWRTPQFKTWYEGGRITTADDGIDDDMTETVNDLNKYSDVRRNVQAYAYYPSIELGGSNSPIEISDVPHFNSECIEYFGEKDGDEVKWTATNNCMMVNEDVMISSSSNGRDQNNNLVLSFSASITFDENVFLYKNKHMLMISPTSTNVTDSYRQVENMFAAPAAECAEGDVECTKGDS